MNRIVVRWFRRPDHSILEDDISGCHMISPNLTTIDIVFSRLHKVKRHSLWDNVDIIEDVLVWLILQYAARSAVTFMLLQIGKLQALN